MYGDDALWGWLSPDGGTVLDDKFPTVRLIAGTLTASARRLDGSAPPAALDIPVGYGPIGFQAFGIRFSTPGCWEVTQAIGGKEFRFVVLVVAGARPPNGVLLIEVVSGAIQPLYEGAAYQYTPGFEDDGSAWLHPQGGAASEWRHFSASGQ